MAAPSLSLSRFLALIALFGLLASTVLAAPTPLSCSLKSPVGTTSWFINAIAKVSWSCAGVKEISTVPDIQVVVIELQTGSPSKPIYVDTINDEEPTKSGSFSWIISSKYPPGTQYYIRLRTKLRGDPDPKYKEANDALEWSWSGPLSISVSGQTQTPQVPVPSSYNPSSIPSGYSTTTPPVSSPPLTGSYSTPTALVPPPSSLSSLTDNYGTATALIPPPASSSLSTLVVVATANLTTAAQNLTSSQNSTGSVNSLVSGAQHVSIGFAWTVLVIVIVGVLV